MTFRAVVLGLLGGALICGLTCFNDAVMRQTSLVGSNMPLGVYGFLVLFVILFNPLLYLLYRRLALSGPELAVVLVLTLVACCIPGAGLLRNFTSTMITPLRSLRVTPAWQAQGVVERVPPQMLAEVNTDNAGEVLDGYVQGRDSDQQAAGATTPASRWQVVPWPAWGRTLLFWVPLVLLCWGSFLGLSLVVHRQWAEHEQLPYPMAQFAHALLPQGKALLAETFRSKLFWIAMAAVLAIHLNNYLVAWYPDNTVATPTTLDFLALGKLFENLVRGGGGGLLKPTITFTVIAFAYFLAADVSLALALGPPLWFNLNGILGLYGISMGGGFNVKPTLAGQMLFGSFFGTFLVVLYTGRRYYLDTFRKALWIPGGGDVARESVWGARAFLAGSLGFVAYLSVFAGLDWQIGALFAFSLIVVFLVLSRAMAETGIFYQQLAFVPGVVLLGILGIKGLGVQGLIITMLVSAVLTSDVREALMPFVVNGLKLLDLQKLRVGRVAALMPAALVLGLAVGLPVTLYFQYSRGANQVEGYGSSGGADSTFNAATRELEQARSMGLYEQVTTVSGWGHFTQMAPSTPGLIALAVGVGLVLLFTVARLRFTWWPLHPVMFLFWTTPPGQRFYLSFFLGWVAKVLVTRFGGARAYRAFKPAMFGLIAGEMVAGVLILVIGAVYYFATGQPPKPFSVMK